MVKPNGAYQEREPGTCTYHRQGDASVGFYAHTFLLPKDVSFNQIQVREGQTIGVATGYFHAQGDNGDEHSAKNYFAVLGGDAQKGCRISAFDTVVAEGNPAPYAVSGQNGYNGGTFIWPIPREYKFQGVEDIHFATLNHKEVVTGTGRLTLSKGGLSDTKEVNDPDSEFTCP